MLRSWEEDPDEGAATAISRLNAPEPLRWLYERGYIKGRALDYGSGKGCWYNMECYDPYYRPLKPTGKYDTITCIYVLNVVSRETQEEILENIIRLLKPGGDAYIAVRRDLPKEGRMGRGVYQRYVTLPFRSISKTKTREIYHIHKKER